MDNRGFMLAGTTVKIIIHVIVAIAIIFFIVQIVGTLFSKSSEATARHEFNNLVDTINTFIESDQRVTETFYILQPYTYTVMFNTGKRVDIPNNLGDAFISTAEPPALCVFLNTKKGYLNPIDCEHIEGVEIFSMADSLPFSYLSPFYNENVKMELPSNAKFKSTLNTPFFITVATDSKKLKKQEYSLLELRKSPGGDGLLRISIQQFKEEDLQKAAG